MKNYSPLEGLWLRFSTSKKTNRIMKMSLFLLCACLFFVGTEKAFANTVLINITRSNVQLEEVLTEIENQSNYLFVYQNEVNVKQTVSVSTQSNKVTDVLDDLLSDLGIDYALEGTHIILTNKATVASVKAVKQQTITVKGKVLDVFNEPVIGANIIEDDSKNGTVTDLDGNFSINVQPNAVLTVTYIGYKTQEVPVKGQSFLNIKLQEDYQTLGEVVIVGFGSQKKENLTGAVSQVKMDDVLGSRPITNALSALQGTMPGLQITPSSAQPGASASYNIRGTTSINGGSPLILIDNVPGDIDLLNPEDIESVSVLKDASSTAIYGARAAFGVILVTTKKAKKGDSFKLNYNNNFGFQKSINNPEIADGLQWLNAYKDAEFGNGSYYAGQNIDRWIGYLTEYKQNPSAFNTYGDGVYVDPSDGVNYYLNEKNPYTNMFENHGFQQSHNASLSGGSESIVYRMSLGYNDQQGILITDKDRYKRTTAAVYVSSDVTSWLTQSADIRYAQGVQNMPITASSATLYDMRLPSLYPEGNLIMPDGTELPTNTPANLLKLASDNKTTTNNTRIMSKTTVKPLAGLEAVFEYTFNRTTSRNEQTRAVYNFTNIQLGQIQTFPQSSITEANSATEHHAINAYATYNKSFKKNNFTVMAGFNQEYNRYEYLYTYAYDLINDELPSFNTATGEQKTITNTFREYAVRGAFYRVNYDYGGRYLLEANGRYDGSSKFPKSGRFGFFPSFSAGWNVARESFMENVDLIGELKPRVSWGKIGNQAISPYQFTPTMSSTQVNWIVNGDRPLTLNTPGLVSDYFTWENVITFDVGVDIAMFNNRLQGTFDWYRRDTKDMLAPGLELPALIGASAPLRNVANLRTKGWELSLQWRDRIGAWGYNVGFNLYDSRTKVTKYDNETLVLFDSNGNANYYEGYEVGQIWGYVTDGFYTVDDFEDTNTWKLKEGVTSINGTNVRPGDVKFKNIRDDENSTNRIDAGDGTLNNPGDRVIIGNNANRFQYGINLGASYKGFELNLFLQGVGKRDVWLSDARIWAFANVQLGQIFTDQLHSLKPLDPENGNWYPVTLNVK